jgi:hypothetical protein
MDEAADIAVRTQRFDEAARAYTPRSPSRHATCTFQGRHRAAASKGGSLRLIRELLATVGVAVGTDTNARFIAEVNGDLTPHRTPKRPGRQRAADPRTVQPRNAAVTPAHAAIPPSLYPLKQPSIQGHPARNGAFTHPRPSHCRSAKPLNTHDFHDQTKLTSSLTAKASARASSPRFSSRLCSRTCDETNNCIPN